MDHSSNYEQIVKLIDDLSAFECYVLIGRLQIIASTKILSRQNKKNNTSHKRRCK